MQMTNSFKQCLLALSAFLVALSVSPVSRADGGGGPSSGPGGGCRLQLDSYLVSFTAYQPQLTGTSPYCVEIPETGNISIVFDLETKELRDKTLEFEITKEKGGARIFYQAPDKFPTGVFNRTINITEPGDYFARVSLLEDGKKHDAQLKFHVAETHGIPLDMAFLVALGLLVVGYFLYESNPAFKARFNRIIGKES